MKYSLRKKLFNLDYTTTANSNHFYKNIGKWLITIDINSDLQVVQKFSIFMSLFESFTGQKDINDLQRAYNILAKDLCCLGVIIDDN